MGNARNCAGLPGGWSAVRQEHEPYDQLRLLGCQRAGLTPAVRLTSERNPAACNGSQSRDRRTQPGAIFRGVCRSRRSRRPLLTKGQIAPQDRQARQPERLPRQPEAVARYSRRQAPWVRTIPSIASSASCKCPRTPFASKGIDEFMAVGPFAARYDPQRLIRQRPLQSNFHRRH